MKSFKMTLTICVVSCYLLLLGIQSVVTFENCVQVDYCQCAFDSGGGINLNGIRWELEIIFTIKVFTKYIIHE